MLRRFATSNSITKHIIKHVQSKVTKPQNRTYALKCVFGERSLTTGQKVACVTAGTAIMASTSYGGYYAYQNMDTWIDKYNESHPPKSNSKPILPDISDIAMLRLRYLVMNALLGGWIIGTGLLSLDQIVDSYKKFGKLDKCCSLVRMAMWKTCTISAMSGLTIGGIVCAYNVNSDYNAEYDRIMKRNEVKKEDEVDDLE